MKNREDLENMAMLLLKEWFPKQCRNIYQDYYWYYLETTPEHDGGIIICAEQPPNKEYKLAMAERINKGCTIEQNFYRFLEVAGRLPVLSAD